MPDPTQTSLENRKIEENICIKNKNDEKIFKFHFIYDNL